MGNVVDFEEGKEELTRKVDAIEARLDRKARVQYAYIEEPKIDQTSLHQPKEPLT